MSAAQAGAAASTSPNSRMEYIVDREDGLPSPPPPLQKKKPRPLMSFA